jgi:hypothetical protein
VHANVTHGNLTVVYQLDISPSMLSLDEWMTISLRVHNMVQLQLADLLRGFHFDFTEQIMNG